MWTSVTMQKMHTHTHTLYKLIGVKGQCCLTEIFWEEECLELAFEGRELELELENFILQGL